MQSIMEASIVGHKWCNADKAFAQAARPQRWLSKSRAFLYQDSLFERSPLLAEACPIKGEAEELIKI